MPRGPRTTGGAESLRASSSGSSEAVSGQGEASAVQTATQALREALEASEGVLLPCEPSPEGVLAAVGMTYLARVGRTDRVRLARADACQPMLGEATCAAPPAADASAVALARRVLAGVRRSTGAEAARRIVLACAADGPDAPEAVRRYVRTCFACGRALPLTDPSVLALDDLARTVTNEVEKTRQFVRFSHVADGSWMAVFRPAANTVPLVANHFAERMGTERFCLLDPARGVAALHETGQRRCQIVRVDAQLASRMERELRLASDESYVRALWKRLYDGLALEGRSPYERGYDLRTHWMPKRLWEGLVELDPRSADPGAHVPARYAGRQSA